MNGYTPCACRDCMETAIGEPGKAFCHECVEAGCPDYQGQRGMSQECRRPWDADGDPNECEHCEGRGAVERDLGAHGKAQPCDACDDAVSNGTRCPLGDACPEEHGKVAEVDDEPDYPTCPLDGGIGVYLGQLGSLEHFRCRACGMDFNRRVA